MVTFPEPQSITVEPLFKKACTKTWLFVGAAKEVDDRVNVPIIPVNFINALFVI
jgi:hypothetical protein